MTRQQKSHLAATVKRPKSTTKGRPQR